MRSCEWCRTHLSDRKGRPARFCSPKCRHKAWIDSLRRSAPTPCARPCKRRGDALDREFALWVRTRWGIYVMDRLRDSISRMPAGTSVGFSALWEAVRSEGGKLDNSMRALAMRALIAETPALAGVFRVRRRLTEPPTTRTI